MKKLLNIITGGKYQKFKTIFIVTICAYIAFFAVMTALLSNTNSDAVMNVYIPLNICLSWALIVKIFYKVFTTKEIYKISYRRWKYRAH